MKLKLSATSNMIPGESLLEKAEVLRELGYSGMAIFVDYPDWKDEFLDEMLEMEQKTGIKPCEFCFTGPVYGHLMDKDPEIRKQAIPLYKRSIDIANKLGAITEMEYEYRPQDPLPLFDPYQVMPEEEEKLFLSVVNELGVCVQDGAYMLLEACNRYETKYLTTLESCTDILEKGEKTATKNMGLIADFFHLALEENDLEKSILYAGKWIKHVHLGDHNRLAPGQGRTDWKSVLRGLRGIGFQGYMNLECGLLGNRIQAFKDVREYLQRIEDQI